MTTTFIRIYNNDDSDDCATGTLLLRRRSVTTFTHIYSIIKYIIILYNIYGVKSNVKSAVIYVR